MTTNGQMNQTSRVSIAASKTGENSQTNGPEHTIVSSILKKKQRKKSIPTIEPAKQPSSSNEFQNSKLTQISSSTTT